MRSSCSKHRPAALRAARPLRRWLFLLAALSIFGAVAVPAAVADGVCFVWDTNGRSATLTGLTQQQCEPHPPGWNRGKWIEGGSINDNGLPIFAGDPPRPGDAQAESEALFAERRLARSKMNATVRTIRF